MIYDMMIDDDDGGTVHIVTNDWYWVLFLTNDWYGVVSVDVIKIERVPPQNSNSLLWSIEAGWFDLMNSKLDLEE